MTYFAQSLGSSRIGDPVKANVANDSLKSIHDRLSAAGDKYWADQVAVQQIAAEAWITLGKKQNERALALMREAVAREDATEKSVVTPGPLTPARELLGDMLMRLNRTVEARAEYRAALKKEPNRGRLLRRIR